MEKQNKHQALDHHFRSLTTILKALRRIPSSGVAPPSFPKQSTRHLSTINNLCNVLVRTGTEVVAATAAIEPHELSLILSSTEKESQRCLPLQEPRIIFSANSKMEDARSSLLLPSYGSDNRNKVAGFVLKHLVWDGKKAPKLCFQSHGKNAIRLLKAVVNANDSDETSILFCLYVVGAGLPKCLTRIRKGQFLEFFKQDFSNVPRTDHCPMISADRWQRFVVWWTELFPDGPDLDFGFSEPGLPEAVVMSTDHARAIHNAMKQSIGDLEGWTNETKETSSIDSFKEAVHAQLCLASFLAGAGKQVLMPYLSTVIPKASMNYPKQHTVDNLDLEPDYEDDDEDDPETEDIYMSPDWKENCFSWLNLICLHSSSSISLTQLSKNPKHSWLLDGNYVFADRKLSDFNTMEPWRDTIRQIFGESTDWVQKLEKLNEVPIKKGAHGSLHPLQCLLFTGDWSNSFRGSIHCEMFLASGILSAEKSGEKPDLGNEVDIFRPFKGRRSHAIFGISKRCCRVCDYALTAYLPKLVLGPTEIAVYSGRHSHIYPTALPPACPFGPELISHFQDELRRILQSDGFQSRYTSHFGHVERDSFADSHCSNETSASDEPKHDVCFHMGLRNKRLRRTKA